jgi:hypothetical protein
MLFSGDNSVSDHGVVCVAWGSNFACNAYVHPTGDRGIVNNREWGMESYVHLFIFAAAQTGFRRRALL